MMTTNEILTRAAEVLERSVTLENQTLAADLRRLDTAQREALARVEAERDDIAKSRDQAITDWNQAVDQRDTAQAQLAEAVGLLRDSLSSIDTLPGYPCGVEAADRIEAFLARHAQDEQQEALSEAELMDVAMFVGSGNKAARRANALGAAELPEHLAPNQEAQPARVVMDEWRAEQEAQGAQAVDERAVVCDAVRKAAKEFGEEADEDGLQRDAFGEFVHEEPKYLLRICQLYRAAHATQPAAGGPKPIGYTHDKWKDNLEGVYHFTTLVRDKQKGWETPVFLDPPAAAHGDEMDRDEVQMQCLRDLYESGYNDGQNNPNGYSSISEREDAAQHTLRDMRAQAGEGGD